MTNLTERMLENMPVDLLKKVIKDLERLTRNNYFPYIQCPSTIIFLGDLLENARAAYKERTTPPMPLP